MGGIGDDLSVDFSTVVVSYVTMNIINSSVEPADILHQGTLLLKKQKWES